jgi:hypothetical protein
VVWEQGENRFWLLQIVAIARFRLKAIIHFPIKTDPEPSLLHALVPGITDARAVSFLAG